MTIRPAFKGSITALCALTFSVASACDDSTDKPGSATADSGAQPDARVIAGDGGAQPDARVIAGDSGAQPDARVIAEDSGAQPDAQVTAQVNACIDVADCAWGEIDHEILTRADCNCLYGCPYVPLSKTTVARRAAAHTRLCDPEKNGNGESCGIDDCAPPGMLSCEAMTCKGAR